MKKQPLTCSVQLRMLREHAESAVAAAVANNERVAILQQQLHTANQRADSQAQKLDEQNRQNAAKIDAYGTAIQRQISRTAAAAGQPVLENTPGTRARLDDLCRVTSQIRRMPDLLAAAAPQTQLPPAGLSLLDPVLLDPCLPLSATLQLPACSAPLLPPAVREQLLPSQRAALPSTAVPQRTAPPAAQHPAVATATNAVGERHPDGPTCTGMAPQRKFLRGEINLDTVSGMVVASSMCCGDVASLHDASIANGFANLMLQTAFPLTWGMSCKVCHLLHIMI